MALARFHSFLYPRILNGANRLRGSESDDAIRRAFKVWEEVTPLKFTEVQGNGRADIYLTFGSGDHGDQFPFDGPGFTLAHAFPPQSGWGEMDGDVHFDDAETYTVSSYDGKKMIFYCAIKLTITVTQNSCYEATMKQSNN